MHRFSTCPLAIVGMGLRLPGADGPESYWQMLLAGRNAIGPLPAERLDRELYYQAGSPAPAKTYTQVGGTVLDRDLDPTRLGLTEDQIRSADTAHLWFLHVALQTLKNAGIDPDHLVGERMGIYVGHARGSTLVADITYSASVETLVHELQQVPEWKTLSVSRQETLARELVDRTHRRYPRLEGYGEPFTQPNAVASLVARRLKTTGPYMAIDAACASSFAALDLAARAIHSGQITSALVGGCSYNQWSSIVMFSQAQALSPDGSYPFDERANGFISSDGYGAILVEPLERARAAGRNILAVIRSIGSSCDGRGKSLWAPLKEGQVEAIRRAYRDDLSCETIQALEAHATGTKVGDATEVSALAEIFRSPPAKLPIASVKGNIGHTRETAGMAALIKMILAMQHGTVPPAAGYQNPSPEIDWTRVPFRVPTAAEPWPQRPGLPRRCAVDAFGIGGLNYHVVLDGTDQPAAPVTKEVKGGSPTVQVPGTGREPIAVIGLGCVLPGAFRIQDFRQTIQKPVVPQLPPKERWLAELYLDPAGGPYRIREARGFFLSGWEFDWRKFKIPPKSVQFSDPLQFMLIDAVTQAFELAGITAHLPPGHERTAVYVGSTFGSDYTSQLNIGLRLGEFERDLLQQMHQDGCPAEEAQTIARAVCEQLHKRFPIQDEAGSFSSSTLASRIAKHFDFRGPTAAVDAEEAGSLAALAAAIECLRAGDCEVAIAAGGQRTLHHTRFESYDHMDRLARPGHPGFYLAEGAVALVLRRLSDAQKEGHPILAVLNEVEGTALPHADTHTLAICHSTAGAAEQSRALPESCGVIGMTQGASGLVELTHALATLATETNPSGQPVRLELTNIGLRGLNWQLKWQAFPATFAHRCAGSAPAENDAAANVVSGSQPKQPWRIIRLAGSSPEGLRARIASGLEDSTALWQSGGITRPLGPQDEWRLAIVADSAPTLAAKLAMVRELPMGIEAWPALHEQGVFLHRRPQQSLALAFVFPGQGSQYNGMFKALIENYPATGTTLREINATLQELGQPSFQDIAWEPAFADRLGSDTWLTQASVYCADLLMLSVLRSFGLGETPRLIFAHSYGEYPALAAAGAWSLQTGLHATWGRCQVLGRLGEPAGKLISTSASRTQIAELQKRFAAEGLVAPANFNSPEQTALAISNHLVEPVMTAIEALGQTAKLLPVPQPYHSPLLASAQPGLRQVLEPLPLTPPHLPLLSSIGNQYVADPEDIKRRLVDQFVAPLYFPELVERAYAEGVRVFIEVGPRTVATRLIRSILRTQEAMAICTDHPKVPAVEQLLRVRALLEVQDLWPTQHRIPSAIGTSPAGATGSTICAVIPYGQTRILPKPVHEGIPHYDATEHRRAKTISERQVETLAPAVVKPNGSNGQHNQIENLLINFVCEQTGYPPEVVNLDQDLEADLGIDSIKKAQLLGELREQYQIKVPAGVSGLSLAQFVTLRDIARFLEDKIGETATGKDEPALSRPTTAAKPLIPARTEQLTDTPKGGNGQGTSPAPAKAKPDPGQVQVCRLAGSHREIGRQHGQLYSAEIRATLQCYADLLGPNVHEMPEVQEAVANAARYFDAAALEELRGISAGCDLPYERLVALNLGLEPEQSLVVAGCTQLAVRAAANGTQGLIHAANEDSPIALRLGNTLARLVQVRRLEEKPQKTKGNGDPKHRKPARDSQACCLFGGPGQIGSLNGFNEAGLTVTSTMLLDQPRDLSRLGQVHPVLVLRILEQATTIPEALEIVQHWPRVGAWSLLLSHTPTDRIVYLEYNETEVKIQDAVERLYSTNHSRLLEPAEVPEHSRYRLERLEKALGKKPITQAAAEKLLRDRMDLARGRVVTHRTMNTVCRVDNQISFVFSSAAGGRFSTTPGPTAGKASDRFTSYELSGFWSAGAQPSTPRQPLSSSQVMHRWILRSEQAPAARPATGSVPSLPTLIIGSNPLVDSLATQLRDAGSEVKTLVATAEGGTLPKASQPFRRLILLTALDQTDVWISPDGALRRQMISRHALQPFELVRQWVVSLQEANALDGAQLFAVTQLGGDFGVSLNRPTHPAGGALTGLFKALHREYPKLYLKVLDTVTGEPEPILLKDLLSALSDPDSRLEIGAVRGRRQELRLLPQDLPAIPAKPGESTSETVQHAWHPGSAWIITGGGRGITSQVARGLAVRFGVHLHLLGTTPLETIPPEWLSLDASGRKKLRGQVLDQARGAGHNPQSAWRKVEKAIELHAALAQHRQAGVSFDYHAVDLSDAEALAHVLNQIHQAGRTVRGIVHGAGVELSGDFAKKNAEAVQATMFSKVLGLQHLLALTKEDPVTAIIGFGSVSGRFGGLGQTDYSMASDLMAKLLTAHRKATGIPCTTFCWPAWGEVGMAMRPESRFALEAGGQKFMPVDEGVAHVIRELLAGLPENEVVILDRPGVLDSDHIAISQEADHPITQLLPVVARQAIISGLDQVTTDDSRVAAAVFDPRRDAFLLDHQFEGRPILPAVIGLEALSETVLLQQPADVPFALTDVSIHAGLRFFSDLPVRVRIAADHEQARLSADFFARNGKLSEPDRLLVSARIKLFKPVTDGPDKVSPPKDAAWSDMQYPASLTACEPGRVYHGPVLRTLRRLCGNDTGVWGELLAPNPADLKPANPRGCWRLPAALLDGCLVACGVFGRKRMKLMSLPAGADRIVMCRMPEPGETCQVVVRYGGQEERHLRFDFDLYNAKGEVLLYARGYRTVVLQAGS